jgi:hypothetical protein
VDGDNPPPSGPGSEGAPIAIPGVEVTAARMDWMKLALVVVVALLLLSYMRGDGGD